MPRLRSHDVREHPGRVLCRHCGQSVYRDVRMGFFEVVILKWLPFRPYTCVTCARRELYFTRYRAGGRH